MSRPPRQLPLDFPVEPGQAREDLVVSPANAAAVDLMDRWPDWPVAVTVLAGPPGSGKSHLAAIWRERAGALQFCPQSIPRVDLLDCPALVEDLEPGRIDEQGLFHLLNAAQAGRRSVLLTSRRFPSGWGIGLPDLASRLKAAVTVEIGEPDDALLAGAMTKLFADRQIDVEPHVIEFLVRRIQRSLASAIEMVAWLDRMALEQKTRVTRALAARAIEALDEAQDRPVSPDRS